MYTLCCLSLLLTVLIATDLEDEIAHLESLSELSGKQKARIKELRDELSRINKKKEQYIAEHPEARKLVYASARAREKRERDKVLAREKEERDAAAAAKEGEEDESEILERLFFYI